MMAILIIFNCFHLFRTENKIESCKKVCKNKDVCDIMIVFEYTKILELINTKNLEKHHHLFYRS